MTVGTIDVALQVSSNTAKLPDHYTLVEDVTSDEASDLIEDGIALRGEIAALEGRASGSFTELDDFFRTLEVRA